MNTPSEPVLTPTQRVQAEISDSNQWSEESPNPAVAASFALQMAGDLERAQAEARHHKLMADALELAERSVKAELASAHAVLDDRECQIVRNTKDGYPEGREDRVLMLEERVRALLRMKADYKNWLEQSESGAAGLREYVAYLHEALDKVSGYLHAHNWNWSPEFLVRGDKLREQLKSTPAGKSMVARKALELCVGSLKHMEHCATCAEDGWASCEGGREAERALVAANQELERSGL